MADSVDNGNPRHDGDGEYTGPRAHDPGTPDDHRDDPGYVTRTKFLSGVALATGGVMGAAILVPVVGFAVVEPLKEEKFRWVDVGSAQTVLGPQWPPSKPNYNNAYSTAVSGPDPEADRRVFISVQPTLAKVNKNKADLVPADMELLALWNRCAHLGCPVAGSHGAYACPCHGGAYNQRGHVVAGPPPRPLDRFDVKVTDGKHDVPVPEVLDQLAAGGGAKLHVLIGKAYSIDAEEHPYKLHLPGEPVTGVLSNLYPF